MNGIHPSRAIVDLNAYAANLGLVRRLSAGATGMIPVIKANAYGHGLLPVARAAVKAGAKLLAVATAQEGVDLRLGGIELPVLCMVSPPTDALQLFLEYQLTLTVTDRHIAREFSDLAHSANRVAPVHCKVDTGMGRQGIRCDEAFETLQFVSRLTHLDLQGIYTHFPTADIADDSFTQNQIAMFKQLLKQVDKAGFPYEFAHAANSDALVNYPDSLFDAVRPGLITYGVHTSPAENIHKVLKPVLRWETSVVQVRRLPAGTTVGYGRTYEAKTPITTAVLPVGYADGYKHQLSNKGAVLIRGRRCPVLGSVCMDQIVADVSAVPDVSVGDTATLIGADGEERITAEELASLAGTIPYDILTGIGPRVHREYIGEPTTEA